ncbi:hypothetical protein [Actinomyces oris]|uniref:Uncharacterized protein n=1 Tax=Actinomyces oris TaxID=544580 RepID=A0AAW8LB95_9ACTO|nr:hypothetical protein [Actinomyces oris]MDR0178041.1 hypothetical protein [Actinomyces oris]
MPSAQPSLYAERLVRPAQQVEVPATTLECYITGLYALNIQEPDGEGGDWHDVFHWREGVDDPDEVMLGGTAEVDTNHIYADLGIYEGRDSLLAKGLELPAGPAPVTWPTTTGPSWTWSTTP